MSEPQNLAVASTPRRSWNKGKLICAKTTLQPKHVWAIRKHLQLDGRLRDLAVLNLAGDSKLRACDLMLLRVEFVALHGNTVKRATVRQRRTSSRVRFEVTEHVRRPERLSSLSRKEAWAMAISGPWWSSTEHSPVRSLVGLLAGGDRLGALPIRQLFPEKDQGDLDLQANG